MAMSDTSKGERPVARVARGFRDIAAAELDSLNDMIATIRAIYQRYGFDALETPALEYSDVLGKFLPDQDRPNAAVFSFQDDDEQWLSLRYDLTAPLARYVAQNFQNLPKPFRRYAFGPVYRNEKPGPGRFRQFLQFDADTVGAPGIQADVEITMLAADTLEALGIARGDYVIKVNNRKILDGVLETAGLQSEDQQRKLTVLRAIDKLDRLGLEGVRQLLGPGRKDESGDFTKGAGLQPAALEKVVGYVTSSDSDTAKTLAKLQALVGDSELGKQAVEELKAFQALVEAAGYNDGRIVIDPTCVRGLEYYTGPVFEAELTFEVKGDNGQPVRFGSVGGGGRYDDLVARFTGEKVPATGFSIGVSRLQAALLQLRGEALKASGPVVVLVMDKDQVARYQALAQELRNAHIRAEMYLGSSGMKAQMKYADRRNAPCVIIQGSNEREKGEVTIKDLVEGAKAAAAIKDNKELKATRPAQFTVPEKEMVEKVRTIIASQQD